MTRLILFFSAVLLLPAATTWAGPREDAAAAHGGTDMAAAVKTFQALAAQGNPEGQNNLAELYAKGKGVPRDYTKAREWYEKAAAQGHVLAQNNLAELYFAGLGGPQDYVRAHMWVSLAASQMKGQEQKQAIENREDVEKRMTPAQVAEAKRLSEQCQVKQFKGC
jgi:uncharacterized protein